jgi:hypothetical protein
MPNYAALKTVAGDATPAEAYLAEIAKRREQEVKSAGFKVGGKVYVHDNPERYGVVKSIKPGGMIEVEFPSGKRVTKSVASHITAKDAGCAEAAQIMKKAMDVVDHRARLHKALDVVIEWKRPAQPAEPRPRLSVLNKEDLAKMSAKGGSKLRDELDAI